MKCRFLIQHRAQQTFLVFQDVFKTSSRRLQRNNFSSSKTSSRRLQDVFKTFSRRLLRCLSDVLQLCLQDVLEDKKNVALKTSSRRLQDVFSTSSPRRMFAGSVMGISPFLPKLPQNSRPHQLPQKKQGTRCLLLITNPSKFWSSFTMCYWCSLRYRSNEYKANIRHQINKPI